MWHGSETVRPGTLCRPGKSAPGSGSRMFSYERESRTPQSEAYLIENERGSRARADLHFTP